MINTLKTTATNTQLDEKYLTQETIRKTREEVKEGKEERIRLGLDY